LFATSRCRISSISIKTADAPEGCPVPGGRPADDWAGDAEGSIFPSGSEGTPIPNRPGAATTAGADFAFAHAAFFRGPFFVRFITKFFFVLVRRLPFAGLRLPRDRHKPADSSRAIDSSTIFRHDRPSQRGTLNPRPSPAKIKATRQDSESAKTVAIAQTDPKATHRFPSFLPYFITTSIHSIKQEGNHHPKIPHHLRRHARPETPHPKKRVWGSICACTLTTAHPFGSHEDIVSR